MPSKSGHPGKPLCDDGTPVSLASSSSAIVPKSVDVFLGRGKGSYQRMGNQAFQRIVSSYVTAYAAATKNKDKIRITDEIVSLIQDSGGRFLGFDSASGELYEVSYTDARMKVSQALRQKRGVKTLRSNLKLGSPIDTSGMKQGNPKQATNCDTIQPKPVEFISSKDSFGSRNDHRVSDTPCFLPLSFPRTNARDIDADDVSEFSLLDLVDDDGHSIQDPLEKVFEKEFSRGQGRGANKKDLQNMIAARKKALPH